MWRTRVTVSFFPNLAVCWIISVSVDTPISHHPLKPVVMILNTASMLGALAGAGGCVNTMATS